MSNGDVTNVGSQPVDYTQLTAATDRMDKALEAKDLKEVGAAAKALDELVASDSSISLCGDREVIDIRYKMDQEIEKIRQCVGKPLEFLRPQEGLVEELLDQDTVIKELKEACHNIEDSKATVKDASFEKVKEKVRKQVRELPRKHKESKLSDWIFRVGATVGITGCFAGFVTMMTAITLLSVPLSIVGSVVFVGVPLLALVGGGLAYLILKPSKDYEGTPKELESKWYQKNDAVRLQQALNKDEGLVKRVFLAEPNFESLEETQNILNDDIALYEKMGGSVTNEHGFSR